MNSTLRFTLDRRNASGGVPGAVCVGDVNNSLPGRRISEHNLYKVSPNYRDRNFEEALIAWVGRLAMRVPSSLAFDLPPLVS
jgi:hypothetical protein